MLMWATPNVGARHPEKNLKTPLFGPSRPFLCFFAPGNHCPPSTYNFLTIFPRLSIPTPNIHLPLPDAPERTLLRWRIQRQGPQTPAFHPCHLYPCPELG